MVLLKAAMVTVNLFAGSLIIIIIGTGYSVTHCYGIICSIPSIILLSILGLILHFYEMFNTGLQLFIFTLLNMDYDRGVEILNG